MVAVAATPLAACSDGPKQEFVDAADDLCREADEAINEIGFPRVDESVNDYVERAQEITGELVADLRDLEPPEGDADRIDELIGGLERAAALLEPTARAALEDDTAALRDLQQEAEQVTDEVTEIAESYGFEVCGAKVLERR